MSTKIKLTVNKRAVTGRKVKQLRAKGLVPANIYGKGIKSLSVQLPVKDFQTALDKAGETGVIDLTVDKETKSKPVLIHNLHQHPVTDEYLHVDFHQVDLTKKVTVAIPIELTGEAPAVSQGGVQVQLIDEIEVEALPNNLPDKFVLDVSGLDEIGKSLSFKDIKVDTAKVKLMTDNLDELVVKIEEPTKEEEKPVEEEPAESEEGEEPKEGEEGEAKEGDKSKEGEKPQSETDKPMAEKKGDQPKKEDKKPAKPKS